MCGFTLWLKKDGGIDSSLFNAASDLSHSRGPDFSKSIFYKDGKEINFSNDQIDLAINHKRLKIVDLDNSSNQPMRSRNGKEIILFNGEIYNFREIKQAYGIPTKSNGDTEVLLEFISKYGFKHFDQLNGMWSFVFIDEFKNIYLSKDRYGKKPLFYYLDDSNLIVASEIKSIFHILKKPRIVNNKFLFDFLSTKRWPVYRDNSTFYEEIKTLNPGQISKFSFDNFYFSQEKKIISQNYKDKSHFVDYSYTKKSIFADFKSSVNLRLKADVKIAILVSGGVDSTFISYLACLDKKRKQNLIFVTICDLKGDDYKYAKMLASSLGIKLHEVTLLKDYENLEHFKSFAEDSAKALEMPVNYRNFSMASHAIYQAISKLGVKVVLDGTGGDEIFSTYENDLQKLFINNINQKKYKGFLKYFFIYYRENRILKKIILLLKFIFFKKERISNTKKNTETQKNLLSEYTNDNFKYNLDKIKKEDSEICEIENMHLKLIEEGHLNNFLIMNDRYSMNNSIEVRSPFLDYRLTKYVNMPLSFKFKKNLNKFILRDLISGSVPKPVKYRISKSGFSIGENFNNINLIEHMLEKLDNSKYLNEVFNIERLKSKVLSSDIDRDLKLINFIEILYSVAVLDERYTLHN